jgi:serine/threonine protein phosphatase PrpC
VSLVDQRSQGDNLAGASHQGKRHLDNQDAYGMAALPRGVAMALADGVSTACRAREAADAAVQAALQSLQQTQAGMTMAPQEAVRLAAQRADEAVRALPYDNHRLAEPQATLVLAMVEANRAYFAWVGDSRLYAFSTEGASLLSYDDSWLNEQLAAGTPEEVALKDQNAHSITQCLGMRDDELHIHSATCELKDGAILLLCSDGMWNYCERPEQLQDLAMIQPEASLPQRCLSLVDYANERGGHDNISVVLYRHQLSA